MEKVKGNSTDSQDQPELYRDVSFDDLITLHNESISFVAGEIATTQDLFGGTYADNWGMFRNGVFYERGSSDTGDVSKIRFWKGTREAVVFFNAVFQSAKVVKRDIPV